MKGQKFNENKLPMDVVICKQFPDALRAIARCTEYGHQKYIETDKDYMNFKNVKGGSQTYADALMRHSMQEGIDEESGLPHAWHKAWNALAELQLYIEGHKAHKAWEAEENKEGLAFEDQAEESIKPWDRVKLKS